MEDTAPINTQPAVHKPTTPRGRLIPVFPSVNCFLTFYGVIITSSGRFYVPVYSEFSPNSKEKEEAS